MSERASGGDRMGNPGLSSRSKPDPGPVVWVCGWDVDADADADFGLGFGFGSGLDLEVGRGLDWTERNGQDKKDPEVVRSTSRRGNEGKARTNEQDKADRAGHARMGQGSGSPK